MLRVRNPTTSSSLSIPAQPVTEKPIASTVFFNGPSTKRSMPFHARSNPNLQQ